jgi:hypothetical protein
MVKVGDTVRGKYTGDIGKVTFVTDKNNFRVKWQTITSEEVESPELDVTVKFLHDFQVGDYVRAAGFPSSGVGRVHSTNNKGQVLVYFESGFGRLSAFGPDHLVRASTLETLNLRAKFKPGDKVEELSSEQLEYRAYKNLGPWTVLYAAQNCDTRKAPDNIEYMLEGSSGRRISKDENDLGPAPKFNVGETVRFSGRPLAVVERQLSAQGEILYLLEDTGRTTAAEYQLQAYTHPVIPRQPKFKTGDYALEGDRVVKIDGQWAGSLNYDIHPVSYEGVGYSVSEAHLRPIVNNNQLIEVLVQAEVKKQLSKLKVVNG